MGKWIRITWDKYVPLAKRTEKNETVLKDEVEKICSTSILHGCFGLTTEMSELIDAINENDIPNVLEEIGDIMWYIAITDLYDSEKMDYLIKKAIEKPTMFNLEINPISYIEKFTDVVKRSIFYKKEFDEKKFVNNVDLLLIDVFAVMLYYDLNFGDVLAVNINKLQERFPDKFTNDDAINRDTEKERELLEKAIER